MISVSLYGSYMSKQGKELSMLEENSFFGLIDKPRVPYLTLKRLRKVKI